MKKYLILFSDNSPELEVECDNMRELLRKCAEYEGNKDEWLDDIIDSGAFPDTDKLFKFYYDKYGSYMNVIYEINSTVLDRRYKA